MMCSSCRKDVRALCRGCSGIDEAIVNERNEIMRILWKMSRGDGGYLYSSDQTAALMVVISLIKCRNKKVT